MRREVDVDEFRGDGEYNENRMSEILKELITKKNNNRETD